jgi:hypothetical protein
VGVEERQAGSGGGARDTAQEPAAAVVETG